MIAAWQQRRLRASPSSLLLLPLEREALSQDDIILQVHGSLTQGACALPLQPRVDALHVERVATPREDLWIVCTITATAAAAAHNEGECHITSTIILGPIV
jgi:hypothetical protein